MPVISVTLRGPARIAHGPWSRPLQWQNSLLAAARGTVTGLTQMAYCACHADRHLPAFFASVALATRNLAPATKLVHKAPRACRQQRIFATPKKYLRKHMQHTCNTRATHVQHTCNTTCNRSIFAANSYDFRSTVQNFLLFLLKWPWDAESGQKAILIGNLQEKWSCCSLCCTCVARVLHVCCTSAAWKFPINRVDHMKTCQGTSLKLRKRKTIGLSETCPPNPAAVCPSQAFSDL